MKSPEECDLGILTVISIEKDAMLEAFGITRQAPTMIRNWPYWHAVVDLQNGEPPLKVVIGICSEAGTVSGALRTVRFFQDFDPGLFILAGIAAGQKEKYLMGEVVTALDVADLAMAQVEGGVITTRPTITKCPHSVLQLLRGFSCDLAQLTSATTRILKKMRKSLKRPSEKEARAAFDKEVARKPKVKDCVIGSGNLLVRDKDKFGEFQRIHPKITAIEMEAAGMVQALKDVKPEQPWLVVRGISDYGDDQKDKLVDCQPYAAASAAAYVHILARDASIRLYLGRTAPSGIAVGMGSASPTSNSTPAGTSFAALGVALPGIIEHEGKHSLAEALEKLKAKWVESPSPDVLARVQALRSTTSWQKATPETQARALRLEGEFGLILNQDLEAAKKLLDEADAIHSGDRVFGARLAARTIGPKEAALGLGATKTLEEWNVQMALFIEANEVDMMNNVWNKPPAGIGPDAESRRLHALALITKKELGPARAEIEAALKIKPDAFALRFTNAMLDYYDALSPATPDTYFVLYPIPIHVSFVKQNVDSLKKLTKATETFSALAAPLPANGLLRRQLQLWTMASLANDAKRQKEAGELCRKILSEEPGQPIALQWATERGYLLDITDDIKALADRLGLNI